MPGVRERLTAVTARRLIAPLALCLVLGVPALASAKWIVTPSGNIGCLGDRTEVRCDVLQTTGTPPTRPKSCHFDWGNAFGLKPTGRGRGLCASDTVVPGPGQKGVITLAYGSSTSFGTAMRCTSRRTGLTCRNDGGHGFTLSRTVIKVF